MRTVSYTFKPQFQQDFSMKNVVTVQLYINTKNTHSALNLCRHRDVFCTLIYDKLNGKPKQAWLYEGAICKIFFCCQYFWASFSTYQTIMLCDCKTSRWPSQSIIVGTGNILHFLTKSRTIRVVTSGETNLALCNGYDKSKSVLPLCKLGVKYNRYLMGKVSVNCGIAVKSALFSEMFVS